MLPKHIYAPVWQQVYPVSYTYATIYTHAYLCLCVCI